MAANNNNNAPNAVQMQGGLEYVGKIVEVPTNTTLATFPGFSEFFATGAHQINYLVNPYEGFTSSSRSITSNELRLYAASFSAGKFASGRGTVFHKSSGSLVYSGDFDNGFRSGVGYAPIFLADGSFEGLYRGQWKFSMRHGFGEMVYPDGAKFQGNWSHDRKNGAGIEFYASGGKLFAYYRNDVKQGQGRFSWNVTSLFEVREYRDNKVTASTARHERELFADPEEKKIVDFFSTFHFKVKSLDGNEVLVENATINEKPEVGGVEQGEGEVFYKRAVDSVLPKAAKEISESAGKEFSITLNEPSFKNSKSASIAAWMLSAESGFHTVIPIVKAIKSVFSDELSKECFLEKVTAIQLFNGKPFGVDIEGSTLIINGEYDKGEAADVNAEKLEKLITSKL